eukprot:gb/GEZN01004786.1/.p1 GENE.gb/GEZN01004786.1/~~gb/GEZN01004786.1/.p1  ORF type:complete len:530 (+),score=79.26 gb/GEZN01004786.1/:47-1636(+)
MAEQEAERQPVVSFLSLRRAKRTLKDFFKTYFMFHGLGLDDLFEFLPVLVFVEAGIYHADEENEVIASRGSLQPPQGMSVISHIISILKEEGLFDSRVASEVQSGVEFWGLERKLCAQVLKKQEICIQEVHQASLSKSFDYRVLNCLLYRLRKAEYDEAVLSFLLINEHLVDIHDDLYDYEKDVFNNSFNIFRMYVHYYGTGQAQLKLMERISEYERLFFQSLKKLPTDLQKKFQAREQEAMQEDGAFSWIFPSVIRDEAAYRAEMEQLEASVSPAEGVRSSAPLAVRLLPQPHLVNQNITPTTHAHMVSKVRPQQLLVPHTRAKTKTGWTRQAIPSNCSRQKRIRLSSLSSVSSTSSPSSLSSDSDEHNEQAGSAELSSSSSSTSSSSSSIPTRTTSTIPTTTTATTTCIPEAAPSISSSLSSSSITATSLITDSLSSASFSSSCCSFSFSTTNPTTPTSSTSTLALATHKTLSTVMLPSSRNTSPLRTVTATTTGMYLSPTATQTSSLAADCSYVSTAAATNSLSTL